MRAVNVSCVVSVVGAVGAVGVRAGFGGCALLAVAATVAACGSAGSESEAPPPEIAVAITSPAPGAELLSSEHSRIVVTGTVATTDPSHGALEAWVNGTRVEVQAGTFRAELVPEIGVNHIKVEGGDGIGPLIGQELDVMWAPAYLAPLAGQTGFDVAGALELRLGQRFFDGRLLGSVLDRTTDPVIARDVSSALELILWHVDLASLLPPGGIHLGEGGAALDIAIPAVSPSNIVVDARVVEGAQPAIDLKIDLVGVDLAMDGSFTFAGRVLAIDGGIKADLHASARLTLRTGTDGSIAVSVVNVTAAIGPLVPAFTGTNGDELDALITIGGNDFRGLIETLLADQLIPQFTDLLPPFLETLLGATDKLLDNINFTLDAGVGTPIMLQLDGKIGALDVRAGATTGHMTVRQDLSIRTSGAPIHASSRGAPRLDTTSDEPVFNTSGVHLTMREDFLNALLHALWNAGMLEGPLSSAGITAKVSAKLPPVVRPTPVSSPCKIDGERCDVLLQLGQVNVELPGFEQSFSLNASAGARVEVNGGAVALKIQMTPELRVWETSKTPGLLTPDTVRDLVARLVWPQLFGAIGSNLMIALPLPDLAELGLSDLAPGLASAQLQLQMRQRPTITGGQLILGADLSLSTPPPP
jgi:hypothetical protein